MDTLLARHSDGGRVAYGGRGERTARDLLCDAAAVAHALPEWTAERPCVLLGVRRDAYDCVAALLGAWARGYEALVPPADCTREGFLRMAQRPEVAAVVHDTASTAALPIERVLASASPDQRLPDTRHVSNGVLRFSVSEALPELTPVRVTGQQLLREAALVGRGLSLPEGGTYASALLLSSRYAWAVGAFWPLMCGGALLRGDVRDPRWADGFGEERPVLIAAPSQIRMLARAASQPLLRVQRVVSLGAPLPAAAFQRLRAAQLDVSDVYATEHLGCLGARSAVERSFRALPEVTLGTSTVSAPHVTDALSSVALAADGGFIATGPGSTRALQEEQIAWLDGVHDAALISLSERGGWQLALSTDAGIDEAVIAGLLPELQIETFCRLQRNTPAAVSTVSSFASARCDLTRNGAGRHDRTSLLRLFGRAADTTPLSWQLTHLSERVVEGGRYERELQIPERYGYFEGHFPGYPLLPGAAQLSELVLPFVRSVRPQLGRLIRMARLKFQERIVPNDVVQVSLQFGGPAAPSSVDFSLRRGATLCANGRLVFAAEQGS